MTSAARISSGSLASEVWKAAAVPWKLALMAAGIWMRCSMRLTALTASPSALPGARLKLTTVEGNWPWWPMDSCARRLLPVGQHAERNLRAVARFDVEIVQRRGIGLEVLPHLHHHVVLVELGEDGGDLALAEGVVERVVHVGHGDAQPRRGVAVDHQLRAQALVLQVAGHVGDHGFLAQLVDHQPRVFGQLDLIGIFQRVLKLGPADAVFHRQVLQRLQEELNAFNACELGLQAANHLGGGDLAHIERLQVDLDAARVQRGVGSVHADERRDVIDGRILQQNVHELLLALGHRGEADRLRRFADAQDHARILHREEALGNHDEEQQRWPQTCAMVTSSVMKR